MVSNPRVDRTRATALATARHILVEEGWDAVTHLRVAQRSGIARGTLYRHWPERWALLHEVLAEEEHATHVPQTGDLRQDLIAELEAQRANFIDRNWARVVSAFIDRSEREPEVMRMKLALVETQMSSIRALLCAGMARGELSESLDPDLAVDLLIGPLVYRRLLSGEGTSPEFVVRLVDELLARYGSRPRKGQPVPRTLATPRRIGRASRAE